MSTGSPVPTSRERWMVPVAMAIAALVLVLALAAGDPPSWFRQAQTALSVYWMLHGGPWLDYWTPVFGYPWAVPFEFPLYQWIVAGVASLGIGIGRAGILVSFAWLLVSLWPASFLLRSYGLPPVTRSIACTLLLLAPVYLDMGTELMIETQAMALSLGWLALLRGFLVRRSAGLAIAAAAAGAAAALTKVTTIPPYLMLGGLMTLVDAWQTRDRKGRTIATLAVAALTVLPLAAATLLWNHHADVLKAYTPEARMLRSDSAFVFAWNFGTWEQRTSLKLLRVLVRILLDSFGVLGPLLVPTLVALAWRRMTGRDLAAVTALSVAFLLPIAVFTNLYIRHDYYQAANTVFAILAYAVALGAIATTRPRLAVGLVAVTIASQLVWFIAYQHTTLIRPINDEPRAKAVGLALRTLTPPGTVVAMYGLDWSAVAPLYAERRSVMQTEWAPVEARHQRLAALFQPVGGQPMSAVVHCPSALDADPVLRRRFAEIAASRPVRQVAGCAIYLAKAPRG